MFYRHPLIPSASVAVKASVVFLLSLSIARAQSGRDSRDGKQAGNAGSSLSSATISSEPTLVSGERRVGEVPYPDPTFFFKKDGAPDYRAFYRDRYEYMADHFFAPANEPKIKQTKDIQFGDAVTAVLWLAQFDGGAKYLQRGHDLFGILIGYADGNKAISRDCFGFYPVLKAALMLKQANQFDPAWEAPLRRFVEDGATLVNARFPNADSGNGGFDGNQGLARMYGVLLAKKLYPEMPAALEASVKVNDAFTRIIQAGDIAVDSRNYFEVSFTFFIQIARELGREDEIAKSPGLKRMFTNFRDAVTPNGFMPEFGSGYFSPNNYACTPIFLEYAAALYNDPTFAVAARRYFGMLVQSGPARDGNISAAVNNCVHAMPQLLDYFRVWTGPLPPADFVSGVTYRNTRLSANRPAFLILRPSVTPGAPMVLMDLLGEGDHCQREFNASIAYYESDHVPLFYQYGRYLGSASHGNQVIFGAAGTTEPDPNWMPDTWRTFSIPSDRLTKPDGRAVIEKISLRTADPGLRADSAVVLGNLRLRGPAGSKTVSDLAAGRWKGNSLSLVDGPEPDSKAVRVAMNGSGATMASFTPLEFDPAQYVELLGDVKWFGKAAPSQTQFRPTDDDRSWMSVRESALLAKLKDVRSEQRDGDVWARLEFSPYGSFDSSLVRQLVLTREGVLAVRDDILPGQSADGLTAFSLWQMYSIDAEGKNRFTSFGECAYPSCVIGDMRRYRRGMSVFFSAPEGTQTGKQIIPNLRLGNYRAIQRDRDLRTTFARLTMQAGKSADLNFLVVPHAPDADLSKLDSATSLANGAGHTDFKTVCDGVSVAIRIDHSGKWQVERKNQETASNGL
jgi:hypothetical protein